MKVWGRLGGTGTKRIGYLGKGRGAWPTERKDFGEVKTGSGKNAEGAETLSVKIFLIDIYTL